MAVLTEIAGRYMIDIFTDRVRAIVTTEAVTRESRVINVRRNPAGGRVAVIAVVAARNVRRVFARRNRAVMAGQTGADNLGVVNRNRRLKECGAMAIFTDIGGENVIRVFPD